MFCIIINLIIFEIEISITIFFRLLIYLKCFIQGVRYLRFYFVPLKTLIILIFLIEKHVLA